MVDFDAENNFFDSVTDTQKFFEQFNDSVPANLEVDHEDRAGLCAVFFLSKICESLQAIENVIIHKIENE